MPRIEWKRPQYEGYDVLDMVTLAPQPDHPDELIGRFPEHVLMLLHQEWAPNRVSWGVAWLVYDREGDVWGQRLMTSGPSPTNGDAERRFLRDCKEKITGRMA